MLFARSRRCYHCGYSYCHSCSDFQALMQRNNKSGYDPMPVCVYCIENLNITAAGKGQLRGLSLAKLKKYAKDYDIDVHTVVEKDDLIDKLIGARGTNGCLPPARERYYRTHSIPERTRERHRGSSQQNSSQRQQPRPRTTSQPTTPQPSSFPRPDLEPDPPYHSQDRTRPTQPPGSTFQNTNTHSQAHCSQTYGNMPYSPRPSPSARSSGSNISTGQRPQQSRTPSNNYSNLNVPPINPRPRSASTPRTPSSSTRASSPPSQQIPSLDELLSMAPNEIHSLPISSLKAILFRNHVNINMIVEKGELVSKVQALINDERAEREASARRAEEDDWEMQQALERSRLEHEEREEASKRERERQRGQSPSGERVFEDSSTSSPAAATPPTEPKAGTTPGKMSAKAQAMASHLERTGLCVICQDEEANIAIVDCGHLAMCRACSDLIMNSTRECPLCRTRIITEARLLRIFKS